jgi:thiosulfate reductase cytochrome b subunit
MERKRRHRRYCEGIEMQKMAIVALTLFALVIPLRSALAVDISPISEPQESRYWDNDHCLHCHSDKKLKPITKRGRELNLFVEESEFVGTFHNKVACVDCHQGALTFEKAPHNDGIPLQLTCVGCHENAVTEYKMSVHGGLQSKGDKEVPACPDCHGRHNIFPVSDLRSNVNKFRLAATCSTCHRRNGMPSDRKVSQSEPGAEFLDSIHGRALLVDGLMVAPTCSDCHGAHDIQRRDNPTSHISKKNVPDTCGKCHVLVKDVYNKSIHGQLLTAGDNRGPTCIQCHSSHQISQAQGPEFRIGIDSKCGTCHKDRLARYRETFHGKAIALGRSNVAACSDCHGNHNIYKQSSKESLVNPENRLHTCRKCHPAATRNFADYIVHADHTDVKSSPVVHWTFVFMTALLIGTFAFFAFHSILWGIRSAAAFFSNRKAFVEAKLATQQDKEQFIRFKPIDRFLHLLVMFSFILLVVTGMPLKFYYTDWAKVMLGMMQGQAVASVLHRVGAVITVFYFVTHILVVTFAFWNRRARFKHQEKNRYSLKLILKYVFGPDSPMPRLQDFKDFWAHQKWFLGRGERPQFDRWTYWEKFDYLAVFWGVGVIGLSGLILAFPEFVTRFLPGWIINVALVVHSDEALLAAGFIFTFHFFNVHFRPEKFPLDTVMFSGRISRTELYHERRRQLERWEQEGVLDDNRVKDEWMSWKKIAVPAGILAFLLGVAIVVMIYVAMATRLLHHG